MANRVNFNLKEQGYSNKQKALPLCLLTRISLFQMLREFDYYEMLAKDYRKDSNFCISVARRI